MESIPRVDVKAFNNSGVTTANTIIEYSGLRINHERQHGRSAGVDQSDRFKSTTRYIFDGSWITSEYLPSCKTE